MKRLFRCGLPWAALIAVSTAVEARQPDVVCGAERHLAQEELFLHRRSLESLQRKGASRTTSGAIGRDAGDIAVMFDSGGVVARRNPFNLQNRGLAFRPVAGNRYGFRVTEENFDRAASSAGARIEGLLDDDTRRFPLPFRFTFYGRTYQDIWVNSDGNVTFGEGDSASVAKSVGLLAGGPPRIAPLFVDLDPTRPNSRGVRVFSDPTRFVVTWESAEFASGSRPAQLFQLRIYPSGEFEFSYPSVSVTDAVVGISPGRATGVTEIVSFLAGSNETFAATVAERFSGSEAIDSVLLAQRFYQIHDDAYDYLAVFNTVGIAARPFAIATELTVRSLYREGFGDTPVDLGRQYGSARRLQAFLNMGQLSQYPRDPRARVPARGATGDTPLTVLAHEAGHLWLALASIRDDVDPAQRPMLGAGLVHWSFNLHSDASFLEGNRIRDNGENANPRFTTTGTVERYSELDQYLMGFRAPEEVSPTFLVRRSPFANDEAPRLGVSFNGQRQDISIEDLIRVEGRRSPDHTVSQRHFRMAFILLVREGTEPNPADLEQLETLRREFEVFFAQATSGRAAMETGLKRNLRLSIAPAAGMLEGATLEATLQVDRALTTPLTVHLRTRNGVAQAPPSVTIPAGATSTTLPIRGLTAGVEDIEAEPADPAYRTEFAKLQVRSSASELRLQVVGGDKQLVVPGEALVEEIQIRATDINLIPYPGLTIHATATGSLDRSSATTDEDGIARFRWTPSTGAANRLRAVIAGTDIETTATALSRPAFHPDSVLNAASYRPGLTPGAFTALFGASLAAGRTAVAGSLPWPFQLAGVQVLINGQPAALHSVSDGQINFVAPRNLVGPWAEVAVYTALGSSETRRVAVLPVSPGIFFHPQTEEAAAVVTGSGQLTSVRPARPGDILEVYGTGLGAVRPAASGWVEETVILPRFFVGEQEAEVLFSGLSPGIPGLYQLNIRVPATAPAGKLPIAIWMGDQTSNQPLITVVR
ncbi:MAG: hypothetical protein NZV14_11040 [Bryobacteraceae bacterium]|nr:hypothetical protein [Bryobacteraceae bacterium]MDW8378687.1 hypothetical protein [Bryobacterales bacterium]